MTYVVSYRAVEGFLPLAQQHGPAHVARLHEFRTREAAEEFIAGDPFVLDGVVASHSVRPWNEVLQPD